ncbi:phage protease [Pararhodobacter marinus]|uniref:phage protease n=1 Tax=Pararhodobacter marinus TaxID=2184063 RepID=UPI003518C035
MSSLQQATCDRALPPSGIAPEWVHLIPPGRMPTRDGRKFNLADPGAVILDFNQRGVDLPIDYEHQMDKPSVGPKGPVPAAGWIKELAHDETGIWGRVEWTAAARDLITRKEYRYLSPVFLHADGQVRRLIGAGLVHRPNLQLRALASEETAMPPEPKPAAPASHDAPAAPWMVLANRLLHAFDLPADVTEEKALDALKAFLTRQAKASEMPDPARFVPIDAVRDLMADRNSRLATLRENDAKSRVEAAISAGHLTPAMRGWATALCASDPASFDAFVSHWPAPFAHLHRRVAFPALPGTTTQTSASDAELAVCAQPGLTPERLARE